MNYLCIDLETTGFDPKKSAITQIAAIPIINGVKHDPFVSYVKPFDGASISPEALRVTGLRHDQLWTFPDQKQVLTDFIKWIEEKETMFGLLGHKISFDQRFLYTWFCMNMMRNEYMNIIRPNLFCTEKMARDVFKNSRSKPDGFNLGDLCKFFSINLEKAHDAFSDISATYELYQCLKSMLPSIISNEVPLTYKEKRNRFLDLKYFQHDPVNGIFISAEAMKIPSVMRFLSEELYHLYGDYNGS